MSGVTHPARDDTHALDTQVLRLALVLTGGVSLAVWMGGVVAELQELTRPGGRYAALCELTRTRVSIDVIGGSSAGGINGALLAVALAFDADLTGMRDVWLEHAGLDDLLREPGDGPVPSLLRGDDYFMPTLHKALTQLAGGRLTAPADRPLDVILTGTLLDGQRQEYEDDFGSALIDTTHRAEFRFRRGAAAGRDDFADPHAVDKLALACRATSSFPGAFEPVLCRLGPDDPLGMARHVNFTASSYVIDGGVLVNKPLRPVLDALADHPAAAGEQRIVAYVQPAADHATSFGIDVLPGFARVVQAGLLTLPHTESLARDLAALTAHNDAVDGPRTARLLHISAEATNSFDERRHPQDKLAGLQLQHFGAFYRSSWRANDWMWGRLDAATRITQLLLSPGRIAALRRADPSFTDTCLDMLRQLAAADCWDEAAVRGELESLGGEPNGLPRALPACVRAAAGPLQAAVLREELPVLVERLSVDHAAGHRQTSGAGALRASVAAWSWPPTYGQLQTALVACTVGSERLDDDAGSPAHRRLMDKATRVMVRATRSTHRPGERQRVRPPISVLGTAHDLVLGERRAASAAAGLLAVGGVLLLAAAGQRSAQLGAASVGALLAVLGVLIANLLSRRPRRTLVVTLVAAAACVPLAMVGTWVWRASLLAVLAADLGRSVLNHIGQRSGYRQPSSAGRSAW